jgi:hypothetical protein
MAMGRVMPPIFLSGSIFPLDSMPTVFWYLAQLLPTTWVIDAARKVTLRGAGWAERAGPLSDVSRSDLFQFVPVPKKVHLKARQRQRVPDTQDEPIS